MSFLTCPPESLAAWKLAQEQLVAEQDAASEA
jgi:hypothetical protein